MKKYFAIVKLSVLGLLLGFGLQYAFADWTPPPAAAPTCPAGSPGCEPPVNVGTVAQVKNGSLSVNAFIAYMNSIFKQSVTVEQLAAPTATPRNVCTDQNGKLVSCDPKSYSGVDDFIIFSLSYQGGSSWVLDSSRTLITSNPANANTSVQLLSATRVNTGHYMFDVIWPPLGNYHINSAEVISATLINQGVPTIKMALVDQSGNNRIEIMTSDDATANDLAPGSVVKFMVAFPVVN